MKDLLIYGIGNPGRQDDVLGIDFVLEMEKWYKENNVRIIIDFLTNYQLNIEDAKTIADYKLVVIADASKEIPEGYQLIRINPKPSNHAMSHFLSPGALLNLCNDLFGQNPAMFALHLAGYKWSFGKPATKKAKANLHKALEKFRGISRKARSAGEMENELRLFERIFNK
jgi:hydrogenase maturation protease